MDSSTGMIKCKNCTTLNPATSNNCSNCSMPLHESKVISIDNSYDRSAQDKESSGSYGLLCNGRKYLLKIGTNTIGRGQEADIIIPDDSRLSKQHFIIKTNNKGCSIKDLGSTNGTFLDGNKVGESFQSLKTGGIIRCGKTEFTVIKSE